MTTILLKIENEFRRRAFAAALAETSMEVVVVANGMPPELSFEIIVSDTPLELPNARSRSGELIQGNVAVAAIGWDGPADIHLPQDVTPRELCLVCSLLREIVRLRREGLASYRERMEMRQLAYSDPLTGIPNRRAWEHELKRYFDRAKSSCNTFALAVVDLDHFKNVNDRYGHASGDEVLKDAARAVLASVRASDFVARIGGDEFGLLLIAADNLMVAGIVERIRRAIATHCSRPAGPSISVSVGYTALRPDDSLPVLFGRADSALQKAKGSGRDRAVGG